jgi:peptide/nickel transport system substrate-binding protein
MLTDVGINASVRSWDWGVLNKVFLDGERTALLTGNGNAQWNEQWIEKMLVTKEFANYSQFSNPKFDDSVKKAMTLPESNPERFKLFKEAFEIVMDEVPMITIHAPDQIDAYRSNVKNYNAYFDSRVILHRVDI